MRAISAVAELLVLVSVSKNCFLAFCSVKPRAPDDFSAYVRNSVVHVYSKLYQTHIVVGHYSLAMFCHVTTDPPFRSRRRTGRPRLQVASGRGF